MESDCIIIMKRIFNEDLKLKSSMMAVGDRKVVTGDYCLVMSFNHFYVI